MTHLKKYWIAYLVLAILIVVIVTMNWTTITGWFSSSNTKPGAGGRMASTIPALSILPTENGLSSEAYINQTLANIRGKLSASQIKRIQNKLGIAATGVFDSVTQQALLPKISDEYAANIALASAKATKKPCRCSDGTWDTCGACTGFWCCLFN